MRGSERKMGWLSPVTVLAELFRGHFQLYYDHEIILILFHDYQSHPVSRALHPCCDSALLRSEEARERNVR